MSMRAPRKPVVYVETSVISFFHEVRSDPPMMVRRDWTRTWWAQASETFDLFSSVAVLNELLKGEFPAKDECLALFHTLPLLRTEPAIAEIVDAYIAQKVMPSDPAGDALHLAFASFHCCDFLVTWNCRHLANANKFGHIRRINTKIGLFIPTLVTPLEMIGRDANDL